MNIEDRTIFQFCGFAPNGYSCRDAVIIFAISKALALKGRPARLSHAAAQESPTGTTGMPIPIPGNEAISQNLNKMEPSSEKQPQNIPQKNLHPIPVPGHPRPTNLAESLTTTKCRHLMFLPHF